MDYIKSNSVVETEEKRPVSPKETLFEPDTSSAPLKQPRAKQKGKRGRSLLAVLAVLLVAGGGGFGWYWWQSRNQPAANQQQAQQNKPQGVPVKLAPVETNRVQDTSDFVGTLEAENAVVLRPEMEGRLSQINVRAGDRVEQGDAIARIDPKEVEARLRQAQAARARAEARVSELQAGSRPEEIAQAEARLNQTEAQLAELRAGSRPEEIAQAEARLNQAEARLAELRAGNRPEEIAQARARLTRAQSRLDALRSGSRDEEIAQARAQIEETQARVRLTEERVQRNQALLNEGAISRDTFDEVVTENLRAKAELDRVKQRLDELQTSRQEAIEQTEAEVAEAQQALAEQESGARPEEIARAEAEVAEAREALAQRQNGARPEEIARVEAEVEERRQQLRQLENGTRPEEIAQAQAQLAEAIAQVRAYEVQLQDTNVLAPFAGIIGDVPVKLRDYVKAGDKLTTLTQNDELELRLSIPLEKASALRLGLPVEISDGQGQPLSRGRVSFISPTVNQESQTVLAKATFNNDDGQLRDRQFVRAKVIWSQRANSIVVPTTAVIFQGENRFIYVARGEEPLMAKRQPIQLGIVKGDRAEVVEGLVPGDRIVVSGIQKLSDGAPIMPLPSGDRQETQKPGAQQPQGAAAQEPQKPGKSE